MENPAETLSTQAMDDYNHDTLCVVDNALAIGSFSSGDEEELLLPSTALLLNLCVPATNTAFVYIFLLRDDRVRTTSECAQKSPAAWKRAEEYAFRRVMCCVSLKDITEGFLCLLLAGIC